MSTPLTLAVPKGRIQAEARPLLAAAGLAPEPAFDDPNSRKFLFATADPAVRLIRVRSFDAATYVAFGAAEAGIVGNDVVQEFAYSELYAPLDLGIGRCRLAVAGPPDRPFELARLSHLRVATKYPRLTQAFLADRGVQAECIRLSGAMELAAVLGLAPFIVDLVSTGRTLAENGLVEHALILAVTSRVVVNRTAMKTRPEVAALVRRLQSASVRAEAA